MPERKQVGLDTVAGGAAPELFDRELARVLENIKDLNTPTGKRTITLKFTFEPKEGRDGERREFEVSCDASSSIQSVKPAVSYGFIEKGGKPGTFIATTNDIRQEELEMAAKENADVRSIAPAVARPAEGGAQ